MCDSGLAQAREQHLGCGRGPGREALEKQIPSFSGVHTRGSLSEVNILGKLGTSHMVLGDERMNSWAGEGRKTYTESGGRQTGRECHHHGCVHPHDGWDVCLKGSGGHGLQEDQGRHGQA